MIEKSYSNGLVEAYEYDASNQLTDITDNYGKHITHEYDGLGNRTGRREETPYNYSVILPEDVSYDKDEMNINEIIDSASDAVSNVIDNKYYCTVSTLEDTTRVVEETYVNDLAQDYAQVLETSRNDEDYESYTYGLTRLSTQSQQGTDYHIINGKFDIIGTVGAMKTSWLSFSLSGKSQAYDTPRFGYSSEAHEGTLQYLRARYYDTETGIFLSKDTYTGTKYNELSQNRYIYTENNPMNRTDPSGNFFKEIGSFFKKGWDKAVDFAKSAKKAWDNSSVGQWVNSGLNSIGNIVSGVVNTVVNVFKPDDRSLGWNKSKSSISKIASSNADSLRKPRESVIKRAPKPVTPQQLANKQVDYLMTGKSDKQLDQQVDSLRVAMKIAGYSEWQIKVKELELVQKYCDRFGLARVSTVKASTIADLMNQKNKKSQQNVLPNVGESASLNGVLGSGLIGGGLSLANPAALKQLLLSGFYGFMLAGTIGSYITNKQQIAEYGFSSAGSISSDEMQNVHEYINFRDAIDNGVNLTNAQQEFFRRLEAEISQYTWVSATTLDEMLEKSREKTEEQARNEQGSTGESANNTESPTPEKPKKDKDKDKAKGTGSKPTEQQKKDISDIADKYDNLECKEASQEIQQYLKDNNIKGDVVNLKSTTDYIVSDSYGTEAISQNGTHQGVMVDGIVYDNIHPGGLPYDQWLADFYSPGNINITITPTN